ncbi:hypothetical protein [Paucibacter sp. KCTC 42545]|uniref:hypothetical protein n=1 Tax=Paucibacter sp. KCTC 42545 TaxID=1768242 RepID=UPI0012E3D60E|nr:hypothetical protein [Paucibacter sp. KCTC 42545]
MSNRKQPIAIFKRHYWGSHCTLPPMFRQIKDQLAAHNDSAGKERGKKTERPEASFD